jgi:exopolysaccharide/PEP-CTERM locus tyrosine autokinase
VLGSVGEVVTAERRAEARQRLKWFGGAGAALAGSLRDPDAGRILAAQHGRVRDRDMNQHSSIKRRESLLERASELYDFNAAIRAPVLPVALMPAAPVVPVKAEPPAPTRIETPVEETAPASKRRKQPIIISAPQSESGSAEGGFAEAAAAGAETGDADILSLNGFEAVLEKAPKPVHTASEVHSATPSRSGTVDREGLLEDGYILPDAPVSALAEEFRIIKRQLLLNVGGNGAIADDKRQTILICSAQPDEGKTFCALNLALSLAGERDVEALLVDGDFAKPEILSILGLESGPGLIDAIADPDCDPNPFVIRTDIDGLSVLPAGRQANNVTELLASGRTREVLAALTRDHPRRVVIFDSPPALMASQASVLASQVGQVLLIVRADQTTEADLKEAVSLLSGCEHLSLMLNGAGFAANGRRFGAYYGYGQ